MIKLKLCQIVFADVLVLPVALLGMLMLIKTATFNAFEMNPESFNQQTESVQRDND